MQKGVSGSALRRRAAWFVCLVVMATCVETTANAQSADPGGSSRTKRSITDQSRNDQTRNATPEIVITAVPDGPYPVTLTPDSGMATEAVVARAASADARLFARCIKPSDAASLRDLADGPPNGSIRALALDRIVRDHTACYPGFVITPMGKGQSYGDCHLRGEFMPVMDPQRGVVGALPIHTICQSFYDRGALIEKILEIYAPNMTFTTPELMDAGVLKRFHKREDGFDRKRSKGEQVYAAVAACLVAVHPALALEYPKSVVSSAAEARIRNALIGTAPECVGGAKKVSLDPSEFRVFLADAIYSWALALRGTESLVPVPEDRARRPMPKN